MTLDQRAKWCSAPDGITNTGKVALPGPSSPEDQGNSIPCEDSSQAREIRVAVGWLLKHTLVQLQLTNRNEHDKEVKTLRSLWTNRSILGLYP